MNDFKYKYNNTDTAFYLSSTYLQTLAQESQQCLSSLVCSPAAAEEERGGSDRYLLAHGF